MVAAMFILFLILLLMGVPIAFSLGCSSLFYLFMNDIPLTVIAQKFYAGMDSFTLLCIPGFMLAGALMNGGGITKRILDFCNAFLGHFTGSLALVNIVASMVFAGISGTAIADVCSLGSMLILSLIHIYPFSALRMGAGRKKSWPGSIQRRGTIVLMHDILRDIWKTSGVRLKYLKSWER